MTNSLIVLLIAVFAFLTISHAAPVVDSQSRSPVYTPRQIPHPGFVDNDRYLLKFKKWYDAQAPAASSAFGDDSWNRMHFFPGEKRMDDKFISDDYPNLNSGRLEWNFNRL